jgi:hypothetical protein
MILVKFAEDGKTFQLSGYMNEKVYAETILSAMTGLPLSRLIDADLTENEMDLISSASLALQDIPMWAGKSKPKLEVVG